MHRAKVLGQYFTPRPVVELCYRLLHILDPDLRNPRIIDPACGEGAFLAYAAENAITPPQNIYGIEKDSDVAASWSRTNLSNCPNLFIDDALCSHGELLGMADWVVGNPPFGTGNLRNSLNYDELVRTVESDFTIWRSAKSGALDLRAYPIEVIFLERFWQLARPGGCVAMVLPDGILSNARLAYVRDWLSHRASLKAVISLPQHTFFRTGAVSKASILLFRKSDEIGPVFMAALESGPISAESSHALTKAFEEFQVSNYQAPVEDRPWILFSSDDAVFDVRLDPAYHHPKYIENLNALKSMPGAVSFGELIEYTTYGQIGGRDLAESGVRLLTPANFAVSCDGLVSFIDPTTCERFVSPNSWNDPKRSRLRRGDLLLVNSGVGCIGRTAVFLYDEPCNISQHINLIRVRGIEPEYMAVYLQTRFGRLQIDREKAGVGPCGINFDRIKSILVPIISADVRMKIVDAYQGMRKCADGGTRIRDLVKQLECAIDETA